jgi:hypothetical protein
LLVYVVLGSFLFYHLMIKKKNGNERKSSLTMKKAR